METQQTKDETNVENTVSLTVDAIKRVGRDVKDILKEPHENIVYIHSTTSVGTGYAMIVGTCETPYFCVPMFYRLEFPQDYPHSPPKMRFLTHSAPNGMSVRMHPNYYTNGKCCLSILNSWNGEKWTGCQTIRSLLMTVLMTLTDDPLTNEPGFSSHSKTHDYYRAVVTEAGVDWMSRFINGTCVVRFTKDDEENCRLNQQFKDVFIDKFVKNSDYGVKVLEGLKNYGGTVKPSRKDVLYDTYNRWIKMVDDGTYNLPCYRATYSINFGKTRQNAISTIEEVITM